MAKKGIQRHLIQQRVKCKSFFTIIDIYMMVLLVLSSASVGACILCNCIVWGIYAICQEAINKRRQYIILRKEKLRR